jgi:lysophospholipid acyltransferase (LPLAT)-like uncharacterized protein
MDYSNIAICVFLVPPAVLFCEASGERMEPHRISGWRRLVLWPLGFIARQWGRSLRFQIAPEHERVAAKDDEPLTFVLWHNRLFLTAEIHRRYRRHRPVYGLVSASKDGAWLEAFFSLVGMHAVRGSSSRLGRESATALVGALRAGNDVGITPDGPRGPCYDLKPGALIVTRRTGTPIILVGGRFDSAWRLRSWDKFYLPKPFSRVHLSFELVPAPTEADRDEAAQALAARLRQMNPD